MGSVLAASAGDSVGAISLSVAIPISKAQPQESNKIPDEYLCPVGYAVMTDPVIINCGHIFQSSVIARIKKESKPCPLCRAEITKDEKEEVLRKMIEEDVSKRPHLYENKTFKQLQKENEVEFSFVESWKETANKVTKFFLEHIHWFIFFGLLFVLYLV